MLRDIDKPEYPLPCDPISGWAWWRFNLYAIYALPGYPNWQAPRRMSEIVPVLRWLVHGAVPSKEQS